MQWLDIPAVGLHRRVWASGQDVLDRGVVTHYWAPGAPAPVSAGGHGVYWLAGYRSTHGAPLAAATSVRVGDLVLLTLRDGSVVRYRIRQALRTGTVISYDLFYGPVRGRARVLLQTCLSEARRLLLVGELVEDA